MSEKHTPAPWVEFADKGDTIALMAAMRAMDVCNFATPYPSRADARLMAAAPDLLAALRGVLRVADRDTEEFDAARAAIAKATESQTEQV